MQVELEPKPIFVNKPSQIVHINRLKKAIMNNDIPFIRDASKYSETVENKIENNDKSDDDDSSESDEEVVRIPYKRRQPVHRYALRSLGAVTSPDPLPIIRRPRRVNFLYIMNLVALIITLLLIF